MTTEAIARPAVPRTFRIERLLPKIGVLAFIGALAYLTLLPLLRLQYLA